MGYIPKAERRRRQAQHARGVGQQPRVRDRSTFWAGLLMGAATATGGYFAVRALERAFGSRGKNGGDGNILPNPDDSRARLVAAATGNPVPTHRVEKPPVVKRTIIEEMVDDLDVP